MNKLKYLILIFLFSSCTSNIDKVQGHWHLLAEEGSDYYWTIDFIDSTVIFNKYDRIGFYEESKIAIKENEIYLPLSLFDWNGKLSFSSDTMIIKVNCGVDKDSYYTYKWLRFENNATDIANDFNSCLMVKVNLNIDNESIEIDSSGVSKYAFVNIGYLKEFIRKSRKNPNDSLYFQLNDIITDISDVKPYLLAENELFSDSSEKTLNVIINADKLISQGLIDSVVSSIDSLGFVDKVYRTYLNTEKNTIGIKEITNLQ